MLLAVQFTDDQIAIIGCAVVFGGCLIMMLISQKIGSSVRSRGRPSASQVVPFPASRASSSEERQAA